MPGRKSDQQVDDVFEKVARWLIRWSSPELWFLIAVLAVMLLTAAGL